MNLYLPFSLLIIVANQVTAIIIFIIPCGMYWAAPTSAPATSESEVALVNYTKVNKGALRWKFDTTPFCESQTSDKSPKPTLEKASLKNERVLMESVNCTPIQMEVLNCEYMMINEKGEVKWFIEKFGNGMNADVFSLDLPKTVGCKDHTSLRLQNKIENPTLVAKVKTGSWTSMLKDFKIPGIGNKSASPKIQPVAA